MAVASTSQNSGSSTTPNVAVPTGAASGDIVIVIASIDASAAQFLTNQLTNFTRLADQQLTGDGQRIGIFWKRLTASDAGSYTFDNVGGSPRPWACVAIRLTGRHATNPPVLGSVTVQNTLQASGATITASAVTAVAGDDILHISCPDVNTANGGNGHSSWSLGTEIVDVEDTSGGWSNVGVAKAENVAAGSTGPQTATFATSSGTFGWATWLLRIPWDGTTGGGSTTTNVDLTATATGTASMVRDVALAKAAAASAAASRIIGATRTLTATATGTALVTPLKVILRTLTATATGAVTLVRQAGLVRAATATGAPSITRAVSRTLVATATGTASVVKQVGKFLSAAAAGAASFVKTYIPFVPGPGSALEHLPCTDAEVDAHLTSATVDARGTSAAVDARTTTYAIDARTSSAAVDARSTSAAVDGRLTSAAVDGRITDAEIDGCDD